MQRAFDSATTVQFTFLYSLNIMVYYYYRFFLYYIY